MGPDEFERTLGVGSDGDAGADFAKGAGGFVDLDVDVGVLEKTEGEG